MRSLWTAERRTDIPWSLNYLGCFCLNKLAGKYLSCSDCFQGGLWYPRPMLLPFWLPKMGRDGDLVGEAGA